MVGEKDPDNIILQEVKKLYTEYSKSQGHNSFLPPFVICFFLDYQQNTVKHKPNDDNWI